MRFTVGRFSVILFVFSALLPIGAYADTFGFSYQRIDQFGNGDTASGTLVTTDNPGGGIETITNILNGTFDFYLGGALLTQEQITGVPMPDSTYPTADDLLYLNGGPYLDSYGLAFSVYNPTYNSSGDQIIYYYNGGYWDANEIATVPGTFTLDTAAPEPASLALAGIAGLLMFGFHRYRRMRQA